MSKTLVSRHMFMSVWDLQNLIHLCQMDITVSSILLAVRKLRTWLVQPKTLHPKIENMEKQINFDF